MASNRGAHPEDSDQFGPDQHARLRAAVRDLSWLRSRGYGSAAKKLVGDRYRLQRRQRNAVARSACSDAERTHRLQARLSLGEEAGQVVDIDVFNVLITVEAALGGAFLFVGRDTAYRDVNPLQGTYRVVRQTAPALQLVTQTLQRLGVSGVNWYLDQSVSNVGRVKTKLTEAFPERSSWDLREMNEVDAALQSSSNPVVTSDSAVLDASESWLHLEALILAQHVDDAALVDLRPKGERTDFPGLGPTVESEGGNS